MKYLFNFDIMSFGVTLNSEIKILLTHLKLAHELIKNPKEGLSVGSFAIFSKVRGSFVEFFHGSLLQRFQGLKSRVSVFQEVLHMLKSRNTYICERFRPFDLRRIRS